jgi:hypothetical protein
VQARGCSGRLFTPIRLCSHWIRRTLASRCATSFWTDSPRAKSGGVNDRPHRMQLRCLGATPAWLLKERPAARQGFFTDEAVRLVDGLAGFFGLAFAFFLSLPWA